MEKVSLQHIHDLIRRVEEVLGLWRILVDHQLHIIVSTLSKVTVHTCVSSSLKAHVNNLEE